MVLPAPNLDDRTFQDLVNEARRRIPVYCPEWTDHNLSDPGITLIELFSWMTELLLYRLNRVPDKNYVKFLELLGIRLKPANPASANLTFMLTAPRTLDLTIPAGTEVATVRTETEEAIIFTTERDLTIRPAQMDYFLVSGDGTRYDDRHSLLLEWEELLSGGQPPAAAVQRMSFPLFQPVPQPGNSFYLGYRSDLRNTVLSISLDCVEAAGTGVNPANPPLLWEYWDALQMEWIAFERRRDADAWLQSDGARGLNTRGQVVLHIPGTAGRRVVDTREGYWIRCTVTESLEWQGQYDASPELRRVGSDSVGGAVVASNAVWVVGESLGSSNGKPGQAFTVSRLPMLPLGPGETVEVEGEDNAGWEPWTQVPDFSQSTFTDKHFTSDPATGEILFGPSLRSPGGQEVRYGAVPFTGSQIRITSYRQGGGPQGNVGRDTLTVLKSSIPYVDSVTNRQQAIGGVDPEDVANTKLRGPHLLRTRERAVTEEVFEFLAREASPLVARAKCIAEREVGPNDSPRPGVVQVLVTPAVSAAGQRIEPGELQPAGDLLQLVQNYLDERRLLSTVLVVSEPEYVWASVEADVALRRNANAEDTRLAVERRLYNYIHPVHGGADGEGWPFGRGLYTSELYSQIQAVEGVEYVANVTMYPVNPVTHERGETEESILLQPHALLCSHIHQVNCL
ncbi:MAG: putative baseplate assembly protein [Chloroflexota bacterium]|nr:putative baseplate assembly protein [Chloroflexota bacterium]